MRVISVAEAQAFDRYAQEKLGIPSMILMENAGRNVAEEVVRWLGGRWVGKKVCVVCGVGNNGGDGLVTARHLMNFGCNVSVLMVGNISKLKSDPKINYNILKKMKARFVKSIRGELIIDALFGIGLRSDVRGPYASVIGIMNRSGRPILSVDVPSGLDADTGRPLGIAVRADRTITFVARKKGFKKGRKYCGKIIVRDIGIAPKS